MLRPDGILVTCSCSYHVSDAELLECWSAAQDSHRIIRILENRGQAKDHPNVLGIPETGLLKVPYIACKLKQYKQIHYLTITHSYFMLGL